MNTPQEQAPEASAIRAFLAAPISEAVRNALADIQQRLKQTGAAVGWVKPQNIHLTVLFLGAVFEAQAASLAAELDSIAADVPAGELSVKGLGFFGKALFPRVIWAGLSGDLQKLRALQEQAASAAQRSGIFPDNKPFNPHLTIGRVRSTRNTGTLLELLETYRQTSLGTIILDRVLLMKSTLGDQGPIYTPLHESRLAASP